MKGSSQLSTSLTSQFLTPSDVGNLIVGAKLGEGASSEVFAIEGHEDLVLKVARPGSDAVLAGEARALSLAGGVHAVRLLGVGRNGAHRGLSLALERAVGEPLDELLSGAAVEREPLARFVLVAGAQALRQLHAWNRSHGDFKPENVFVSWGSSPALQLIDFGLSSEDGRVSGGTPRYLPEEVLKGLSFSPYSADAYALAMTVCEVQLPDAWARGASPRELLGALPSGLSRLLEPYLGASLARAPGLDWILDEAEVLGWEGNGAAEGGAVRREYLATRLDEIVSSRLEDWDMPEGSPGVWLTSVLRSLSALAEVTQRETSPKKSLYGEMHLHDRRRFLGRLIGPWATRWSLPSTGDGPLVEALLRCADSGSPRAITFARLLDTLQADSDGAAPASESDDPVEWALGLSQFPVSRELLARIADGEAPESIRIRAAHVARHAGHLNLGLEIVAGLEGPAGSLARGQLLHRAGRVDESLALSKEVAEDPGASQSERAQALAYLARRQLDQGLAEAALKTMETGRSSAALEEVRALAHLTQGEAELALQAVARGEAYATDPEAASRLEGVRGVILHRQGEAQLSLKSFERACELSSHCGAVLEEATYATGWAAAATDAADLGAALLASERAEQLFDALGKEEQTARAVLSRAAVLSSVGATRELEAAVRRGRQLCRQTGDRLCEAYLEFCWADAADDLSERRRAAKRSAELVAEGHPDDLLRASARLLAVGESPDPSAEQWAQTSTSREARLDWYRARAEALEKISSHAASEVTRGAAKEVIQALLGLAAGPPVLAAGPAFVAGAHLSLRIGQADEASRLLASARLIAEQVLGSVPDGYRASASELLWVQQARGSRVSGESGSEQLSDVELLLRALSQRRGFRGLLDHILDLLLMWTGVQRGLLLLRAPGKRLVIRAGRNLDKNDLSPEQRQLSTSMAERALAEGRPVVAVDAVNDLSAIHQSVHALNLRSVLAVPLTARGEVLGVAYLDDRVRRGAFGERELSWVGLIGTVAALAIADERDRLQLRRALRRAQRAEKRLSGELTQRDAELELAERELSRMKGERKLRGDYTEIIGRSHAMSSLLELVDRVAQSDVPALIQGESGTGKELIARAIASSGPRKDRAFVAENCSALPETLLESTLFGHQKGAFTGATRNQAGLFELAHRGTLFLDEIGDMSLGMQTKLLRVLQEGEVRSLGSDRPRKVDVRVIVATHKDLKNLVEKGEFREDLYYRLNVVTLQLPALRQRQEDIPALVEHFLKKYSPDDDRALSQAALHRLSNFPWPGNVRQLENEVRRMLVLGGEELTAADLSPEVMSESSDAPEATTLREKVDALERRLLVEALEEARGNRTRASAALGLSRFGLQKMAQRLKIPLPKNPPKAGRIKARGLDETQ